MALICEAGQQDQGSLIGPLHIIMYHVGKRGWSSLESRISSVLFSLLLHTPNDLEMFPLVFFLQQSLHMALNFQIYFS